MDVSIVAERVSVYEKADEDSAVIAGLTHGERVRMGKYTYRRAWLEIFLSDGKKAYIFGTTPIRAESMTHCLVIQQPWVIRSERQADAPVLATVDVGGVVACGAATSVPKGGNWIEVALKDGTLGYVDADQSRAQRLVWSELAQDKAQLHQRPDPASPAIATLRENFIFAVGIVEETEAGHWIRAILPDGTDGHLPADTQIKKLDVVHAETMLPITRGKCVKCSRDAQVKLAAIHLGEAKTDDLLGICVAPVCDPCLGSVSYKMVAVLLLIGVAAALVSMSFRSYFIGVLGFLPLGLYTLNAWQQRGRAIRYRHLAEDTCEPRLRELGAVATEVEEDEIIDIQANWVRIEKWLICPGCLQLHLNQPPWCPGCGQILNYRMYPRS